MPPKGKIESSPNFNQILDWIDEGKSSRWISRELKNQFNEKIGHVTISTFRKKEIRSEAIEIVDTQLKKEAREKEKKETKKKLEEVEKQHIPKHEQEAKKQEVIRSIAERKKQNEEKVTGLAAATAKQYRGVLKVAEHFEADYYKLRDEAKDPYSKTTWKDVTDVSFKAVKLAHEMGQENESMEDTVSNGFEELANAIQKSREILKKN